MNCWIMDYVILQNFSIQSIASMISIIHVCFVHIYGFWLWKGAWKCMGNGFKRLALQIHILLACFSFNYSIAKLTNYFSFGIQGFSGNTWILLISGRQNQRRTWRTCQRVSQLRPIGTTHWSLAWNEMVYQESNFHCKKANLRS